MRKQTLSSMTRKLDKRCSDIVRSKGYCEKCGPYKYHDYSLLQCAHIYSRKFKSVRFDFLNLLCLCAGCHFAGHQKPLEFAEFVKSYLGEQKYAELKIRANAIKKWTVAEMTEYYESLNNLPRER